jgi:hypothetical protein
VGKRAKGIPAFDCHAMGRLTIIPLAFQWWLFRNNARFSHGSWKKCRLGPGKAIAFLEAMGNSAYQLNNAV